MADRDHPPPSFVALRAATLGIDDISRQALRGWLFNGLDHRGALVPDHPAPSESATVVIVAGILRVGERDRMLFRQWVGRWTDYTGRIITPHEQERRFEEIRLERQRQLAQKQER